MANHFARIIRFIGGCSRVIRAVTILVLELGAVLLLIILVKQILAQHS